MSLIFFKIEARESGGVTRACKNCGLSRKTYYKWWKMLHRVLLKNDGKKLDAGINPKKDRKKPHRIRRGRDIKRTHLLYYT